MKNKRYSIEYDQEAPRPINRGAVFQAVFGVRENRHVVSAYINFLKKTGRRYSESTGQELLRQARHNIKRELTAPPAHRYIVRQIHNERFEAVYNRGEGALVAALNEIKSSVQEYRRRLKENHDVLLRRAPGWVIKRMNSTILKKDKRPKDDGAYVGIEIECILPESANLDSLIPFGKYISVVGDGSIDPDDGEEGREIRVCVKRSEVRQVIPGIVDALVSMGGRVNKSCGLHVHLDQRNNPEPSLTFQKLVRSLGLLYTVVPESRRTNSYCKRNRHAQWQVASNGGRYKAINASAYYKHKTIEVRLFGGTLEAKKIINWVEVLTAISEGEALNRCPKNFDTARAYWKLTDENVQWLKERQAKFGHTLADTVEAQSDVVDVPIELAQNLELSEAA